MNSANEISKRESRGGIGFELVLEDASCEAPKSLPTITSPTRTIKAEDIEAKLKAAEERRKSMEAEKLKQLKEHDAKVTELRNKLNEMDNSFRDTVRESIEKKMDTFKENRENVIKTVIDKVQDHARHIDEVRQNRLSVSAENVNGDQ